LPRKTDSSSPADWLYIAESDLEGVQELASSQLAYEMCRSKLAEIIEKILKAELIRSGWFLEKTHDLEKLAAVFQERGSDLTRPSARW
jgi:HEPN domain-containing protein